MRVQLIAMAVTVLGIACGKQLSIPEPAGVTPGAPHMSWVVMRGDAPNPDREYVCQSEPRDECIVPASRDGGPVFSDVHFYYHAAGVETTYSGKLRIGFLRSSAVLEAQGRVKPKERAAVQSVTGIVTSAPGRYEVTIDVVATAKDGTTQLIHMAVPITVK